MLVCVLVSWVEVVIGGRGVVVVVFMVFFSVLICWFSC